MDNARTRRRNSLRHPTYDYSQPGSILVTVCTYQRQPLFGYVRDGQMCLSEGGRAVADRWNSLPARCPSLLSDTFIVMPDHVHGIVHMATNPEHEKQSVVLGDVIRSFKASAVRAWWQGVAESGWPRYDGHLWQGDYHDRILHQDQNIDDVRAYIEGNPATWGLKRRA